MSKPAVPSIPPLSSISDPNVRAVLQAFVDGQRIRNGDVGDGDEKFLTVGDLERGASLSAVSGDTPVGTGSSVYQSVGKALRKISNQIMQSRAWKLLDQGITRLNSDVATVQQQLTTVSDQAGDALAAVTTMQSQIAEVDAAAQEALTLSTSIDSTVKGAWSVKFDVNGYVAGVALGVEQNTGNPPKSSFVVRADTFAIGSPGVSDVVPFFVQNGVTYIQSAMIPTLTADKIDTRDLTIKDAAGKVLFGAGIELNWSNIVSVGQNIVQSLSTYTFSGSPGFWRSASMDSVDGLALTLEPSTATWVTADSPQMSLSSGTYTLSFEAYVEGGGSRSIHTDLFPDDLPESVIMLSGASWKPYQTTWTSSNSTLADCHLRFFAGPGTSRVSIRNVKFEAGSTKTAWSANTKDTNNSELSAAISNAAATATWANVSGTGKPADNATVGASFGVNIWGQISAANISTYIAAGAIGTAYIGNASITNALIADAQITAAKIADANITTAKIADAQVNTLKIAGEAVTVPRIASGASSVTTSGMYLLSGQTVCVLGVGGTAYNTTLTVVETSTGTGVGSANTGTYGGWATVLGIFTAPWDGWFYFRASGTSTVSVMAIGAKR